MRAARTDVLAFVSFPRAHWRKICSTNPLERLNKEVKRLYAFETPSRARGPNSATRFDEVTGAAIACFAVTTLFDVPVV
jgi:hypothetical protein